MSTTKFHTHTKQQAKLSRWEDTQNINILINMHFLPAKGIFFDDHGKL
jgi:hypothetical protein